METFRIFNAGEGTNLIYKAISRHAASIKSLAEGTNITLTDDGLGTITIDATGGGSFTGPVSSTDNALVRFDGAGGDTAQNSGVIVDDSNNISGVGTLASGAYTITSASATSFAVGPNGATNPAFQVDSSTASAANGLKITAAAAGAGVKVATQGAGATENLFLDAKGAAGTVQMWVNGVARLSTGGPSFQLINPTTSSSAATVRFQHIGAADTSLTAGTESPSAYFNMGQIRTHASNTAITLQRDFRVTGTTHAFSSSGGVITDAAAFSIDGPCIGGTNATITNSSGLYIPTLAVSNVTNAWGLNVAAPSGGGTINAAARFSGQVHHVTNAPWVMTNQTSGPGAATGTLTNAPSAGDPDFWLPISINGTTMWIPAWGA